MPFFVQTVQLHCDSRSRSTRARKRIRPQWQPPSRSSSIATLLQKQHLLGQPAYLVSRGQYSSESSPGVALRPTGRLLVELRHTVQHRFAKGLVDEPQVERQAVFCEACQDYRAGLVGGAENDKRNCYPRDANHGRHDYRPPCTLISLRQTRLNPQSPRPAMIRIACRGPTCSERMPIITTPTGPVPMHMVTIPITRDRAAGGASMRIKVVCMFEKAAVPSPPISNSTRARAYHGDRAIVARPIKKSSDPRSRARRPSRRSHPVDSGMPIAMAPSGSAAARAPTRTGETRYTSSPIGAINAE